MQYDVYSVFRSWWVGHKEGLQRSVERWSIVIAKVRAQKEVSSRSLPSVHVYMCVSMYACMYVTGREA